MPKIVILDDSADKLHFAHGTAREVLGDGWVIELLFVELASQATGRELAQNIFRCDPTIVVLDNTLVCAVNVHGMEVGFQLRELGYRGPIIANSYGGAGWHDPAFRKAWRRFVQDDLGAGSSEELAPAITAALARLSPS